jgi:glycosyltransferase involved in cell wall biosynthesis
MIILTTTYNCESFIEQSLLSIMSQSYGDFKCYITDDLSTDNTVNIINKTIKDDSRFFLIKNTKKLYQPGNYDQVIRGLDIHDDEICIEVDGDDWLPDSNVFKRVNSLYKNEDVWIANGSFKYSDGRVGFSSPQLDIDNIRKNQFTASHLRTWKSFLWKKIKVEDLKDEFGEYWSVAGDLAFMYPMIEMSGYNHYRFMDNINYIYNDQNPLNDHKVNMNLVNKTIQKLRNKQKYKQLDESGWIINNSNK